MEVSEERRQTRRHKTFKGGLILYGVAPAVPCVIRNLSEIGACLELDDASPVPDQFAVLIKPEDIKRNCQAIWRSGKRIGVQFV
ncbi:MAG: PilZ domain-containing protein [Pseudolabrys sp.]|nr:PilZ domain-containing protein [Pseudolabrys sp.]